MHVQIMFYINSVSKGFINSLIFNMSSRYRFIALGIHIRADLLDCLDFHIYVIFICTNIFQNASLVQNITSTVFLFRTAAVRFYPKLVNYIVNIFFAKKMLCLVSPSSPCHFRLPFIPTLVINFPRNSWFTICNIYNVI